MANEAQTQTGEMATAAQVAEAKATIKKVRDAIARFHTIRRHNNERAAGLRASMVHPAQVQQMLRASRNAQVEAQAVEALRQFITLLNGQEPTQQQMQAGIPEGVEEKLGFVGVPFAVAAVAVALGGGVYSYFNYLTTIEEGNQQRTATPLERALQALSDNVWGVAAVGAIILGGAIYIQTSRSTSERRKAEIEKYKAAGKALEKSMREIDKVKKNPESIVDGVTGFVKNVLFPPENNPDLSPAEKLAAKFEKLSAEEQERFDRILAGEDHGEEEVEESEEEHHHHHHHHEEQESSEDEKEPEETEGAREEESEDSEETED